MKLLLIAALLTLSTAAQAQIYILDWSKPCTANQCQTARVHSTYGSRRIVLAANARRQRSHIGFGNPHAAATKTSISAAKAATMNGGLTAATHEIPQPRQTDFKIWSVELKRCWDEFDRTQR